MGGDKTLKTVVINDSFSIEDIVEIARNRAKVSLSDDRKEKVVHFRKKIERFLEEDRVVYGITTGVGPFWKVKISPEDSMIMQEKFIMSHSCNVGEPFPEEVVRAFMAVLVNNLSKGHACVRLETLETMIEMLNKGVTPYVPQKGSVGYLQPNAHTALVLYGKGKAYLKGQLLNGEEAMRMAGIPTIKLEAKEGLSLMNNTSYMTAIGALALYDSINLFKMTDIAGALSFEALKGNISHFDERLCSVRPYPGMLKTSRNLNRLLEKSEIVKKYSGVKVQDPLSLRMMPQVHGACKDTLKFVKDMLETELKTVSDNPLIFENCEDDVVVHGGNCDGAPVGLSLDVLGIPVTELSNISERRIYRTLDTNLSGLPSFLVKNGGLNSGFMIPQYTAAALVAENKILANPVSVDSIPTAGGQEDYVSFGCIAARKVREMVKNLEKVLSIELMISCQGIDFLKPLLPGEGTKAAYSVIRETVPFWEEDRVMYEDIEKINSLITSGEIIKGVENAIGELEC